VTLQCPSRTLSPTWGQSVGGVSERAGAKAGGSNPFASRFLRVSWRSKASRSSGRRCSSRGAGRTKALVGPTRTAGNPPAARDAPMTADVRRTPRRGTPSACALYAHAPDAGTRDRRMRPGTRPSLGPLARARRSSLCSVAARLGGGAAEEASRLGKLARARGTNTGAFTTGRSAARRRPPLPQGRGRDLSKKRKEIEVSVPARTRKSPGLVARTS